MNILFGIQLTGNGHIFRSMELIEQLKYAGASIDIVTSGDLYNPIVTFPADQAIFSFPGAQIYSDSGKVNILRSVLSLKRNPISFHKIPSRKKYDLVITDFEPIAARYARTKGITSIGISNQYDVLGKSGNYLLKNFIKYWAGVDIPVGLSLCPSKRAIPPIIPSDIRNISCSSSTNAVLVYLPWEDDNMLIDLLSLFPNKTFILYQKQKSDPKIRNIITKAYDRNEFIKDLHSVGSVLTNAGFGLISESLYLGKNLLVKPLKYQLEQSYNASLLYQRNPKLVTNKFDEMTIHSWIENPLFASAKYPNPINCLVNWILQGKPYDVKSLATTSWAL